MVFELSLTSGDKVHQVCTRSCNQRKYGHDFVRQFDKWVGFSLDCIPVGQLENYGANSTNRDR